MSLTSQENVIKVLAAFNPWWKSGFIRPEFSKTYKRLAFYEAMKILSHKNIRRTIVLTGARRVGKTTIQYQIWEVLHMLGWFIIIKDPKLFDPNNPESRAERLAEWKTSDYRYDWLKDLEAEGKATLIEQNSGYPNHYRALAGDLLPLIKNGPPSDKNFYKTDQLKISNCPDDHELDIFCWDLS